MIDDRSHNQDQGTNRPLAELLSAYLDDRESLTSADLERAELLLEQDRQAQQVYAELRVISRGLGNLESITAPRSYHLDAEMVGSPAPVALQETTAWYARHTATVRWITAAAAMLFVFVLGTDLVLNNVMSSPTTDSNDAYSVEQAEISSRNAGSNDAAAAADDADKMEESSGDGAGGGDAAPPVVTPNIVDDAGASGASVPAEGESGEAEDEAASTLDAAAIATNPDDAEMPAVYADPEAEAGDGSNTADEDDSASNQQALKFEEAQLEAEDGGSDRRIWRIAEFSLVVLLGLFITLMVVLPRLPGSTRVRGE